MTRYIDADEYYDELLKMVSDISFSNQEINGIRNAIARLQAQPTADVQPVVHAKWIHDADLCCGMVNLYHCSECGRAIRTAYDEKLENYPYCHCGAKMDGDEHDTD